MRIKIEDGVKTATNLFFSNSHLSDSHTPILSSVDYSAKRINEIVIPIYQRNYDWEEAELKTLLKNTNDHLASLTKDDESSSYFTGTILIECKKIANRKSDSVELIDGQQRLTTSYLMSYLAYILAVYRHKNFKGSHLQDVELALRSRERLENIEKLENRIFTYSGKEENFNLIFKTEFYNRTIEERKEILNRRLDPKINLVDNFYPILKHKNPEQKKLFISALKNTEIKENEKGELSVNIISENDFNNRIHDIFNYFKNDLFNHLSSNEDLIDKTLEAIEKFNSVIAYCVIVSENELDSFKLFEVLNGTGRKLTLIDKLKNYLYNYKDLDDSAFNNRWKSLNEFQDSCKRPADLTKDIVRSEGSTITQNIYEYFTNQHEGARKKLFAEESSDNFLDRIINSAKFHAYLYNNTKSIYSKDVVPGSINWNLKSINELRYDWGRQVFMCFNNLVNTNGGPDIFENYRNSGSFWNNEIIESSQINENQELEYFQLFLSDILLKIGFIGIINGLSTRRLPEKSLEILNRIVELTKINEPFSLNKLKSELVLHFKDFKDDQLDEFKLNIGKLSYSHSSDRKKIKLLLTTLYNKGRGGNDNYRNPTLEHLEPKNPRLSGAKYFTHEERNSYVHSLGNLIILERDHNSIFNDNSIKEKLDIVKTDERFKNERCFQHPIFLNLMGNHTVNSVYQNIPDSTEFYDKHGAPTEYFFEERNKFYVDNITDMIFDPAFLISGIKYDELIFAEQHVGA